MSEDYYTHTEADAGLWARAHAEDYDDKPSRSDLAAEECICSIIDGYTREDCPVHGRWDA